MRGMPLRLVLPMSGTRQPTRCIDQVGDRVLGFKLVCFNFVKYGGCSRPYLTFYNRRNSKALTVKSKIRLERDQN
jgi:hypothetical protein